MVSHSINKNVQAQAELSTFLLPFVGSELGTMPKHKNVLTETTRIFSANLVALVDHNKLNANSAGRLCKISQPQMARFLDCKQSPQLDSVHKVARGFGVEPYQLLIPGLQPHNLAQAVTSDMVARWQRIQRELRSIDSANEGSESMGSGTPPDRAGAGQRPPPTQRRSLPSSRSRSKAPKKGP